MENLKFVIVGHVDHGKSTLIGRLLLETNSLSNEKMSELKKISKNLGKEVELAFLVDQLKEEREKSLTIDTTQTFFKTRRRKYIIIDAPGHVEFIKNMMTGASLAEAVVLIVDAKEGIMEQTRRHAYLTSMLGLSNIIVVFNKMDLIDYDKARFNVVKEELLKFFEGLKIKPLFMIPISAKEGANISRKSFKIGWYKGPSLIEAFDLLALDKKSVKKPLRFPVQDVYEIDSEKTIVGRLVSGILKQGQDITLLPLFKNTTIKSIKIFGKRMTSVSERTNIGLTLKESLFVKRGEVIIQKGDPLKPANCFKGNIFWISPKPLQLNETMVLRCANQEIECIVEKIEKRINSSTLEIVEEDAKRLNINEAGVVLLKTKKPVVIEKFNFIEELGRFVIERGYNTQGAGTITEIYH